MKMMPGEICLICDGAGYLRYSPLDLYCENNKHDFNASGNCNHCSTCICHRCGGSGYVRINHPLGLSPQ